MVFFEFFDINAMSTTTFTVEDSFQSFVQLLQQRSYGFAINNSQAEDVKFFKPVFVADSRFRVFWTNGSLLSQELTRIPRDVYFPDLTSLVFSSNAVIKVYCSVSRIPSVSSRHSVADDFCRFFECQEKIHQQLVQQDEELKLSLEQIRSSILERTLNRSCIVQSTAASLPVVTDSVLSRPSDTSDSAIEENQERLISRPEASTSISVSEDVSPASVSVGFTDISSQSNRKITLIPSLTMISEPISLAFSESLSEFKCDLTCSVFINVHSTRLDQIRSAFPLSIFAWIPGEEIPPEPPPCLYLIACVQELLS